jgi:hypothetical protein
MRNQIINLLPILLVVLSFFFFLFLFLLFRRKGGETDGGITRKVFRGLRKLWDVISGIG